MTGVFQFGAHHPYLFSMVKSLLAVGVIALSVLAWAWVGEALGMAEIPRAR